jgi:multicomponent Na+:H+ antiporter subunit B
VIRRAYIVVVVVLFGLVFASLVAHYTERQSLPPLGARYVDLVPRELGAPNVITGILLTYRAFDTLGEVAVLFMVAAGVGLVLGARGRDNVASPGEAPQPPRQASEIVQTGAQILAPLIAIFAAYIIMNGHLSAGGGFQGGAVIASSVLLLVLANPQQRIDLDLLGITESAAGVLFVLVGIAGLIFAAGFLDNRVLPLGRFGGFFSAGAIPLLSALLGVKVGCELTVIIDRFRG